MVVLEFLLSIISLGQRLAQTDLAVPSHTVTHSHTAFGVGVKVSVAGGLVSDLSVFTSHTSFFVLLPPPVLLRGRRVLDICMSKNRLNTFISDIRGHLYLLLLQKNQSDFFFPPT